MDPEDLLRAADNEPPPGTDELRAIVARAHRRRWRVGVGGLTAALLIGGGAGYALSNHHSPGQSVATSSASASNASPRTPAAQSSGGATTPGRSGSSSSSGSVSASSLLPEHLQPLFTRTAGAVELRGFLVNSAIKLPQGYSMSQCVISGPRFQAEVSTTKMVGIADAGYVTPDSTKALSDVSTSVVGVAEGDPTLVVIAYAGKGVAQVQVTGFASGSTDSMTPVGEWVALAGPTTASSASAVSPVKVGTITALGESGQVLASESVTSPSLYAGGPQPLSNAAGAEASNGASVVCEGGATPGSGTIAPGQGTGTSNPSCPPSSVPPAMEPGGGAASSGGAQSRGSSTGASSTCVGRLHPAVSGPTNTAAG